MQEKEAITEPRYCVKSPPRHRKIPSAQVTGKKIIIVSTAETMDSYMRHEIIIPR